MLFKRMIISLLTVLVMLLLPLQMPVQAIALPAGNQEPGLAVKPASSIVAKKSANKSNAGKIEVYYNQATGAATFIKADKLLTKEDSQKYLIGGPTALDKTTRTKPTGIAHGALEKYKDLLKVKAPHKEFKVKNETEDAAGLKHIKFTQQYNGIPVWGKEVFVHLDDDNNVYLIEGQTAITQEIETIPHLSAQAAKAAVSSDLGADAEIKTTELVIITDRQGENLLAYHVEALKGIHRWQYFINASNGSLVKKYDDTKTQAVEGYGLDLQNQARNFSVWLEGSRYYLIDTTMAMHRQDPALPGDYGQGNIVIWDLQNQDHDGEPVFVTSKSPTWWDAAGVSALYNSIQTYNIYEEQFNRNGIDGNGGNIFATIHVSRDYDNAYWDGTGIYFGDGGSNFKPLAQSLDVVAHEITHGVIEYSANLIYENQSGALNEAVADIMACIVDSDDWLIGEDITRVSPGYLRSLTDPHSGLRSQPATMDEYQNLPNTDDGDNGGVHVNSSIAARAAYLMAEGLGAGKAIGREKMGQIWYKALTQHLTRSSEFIDARLATIQSAKELYGENAPEVEAVIAAWDAVKVTTAGVTLAPEIAVDQSSIAFNSVSVGTAESQKLTISNTGNYELNILGYQLNNRQFKHDGDVKTLGPGEAYSINVEYVPGQTGPAAAKLVINSDDADDPTVEVTLSGQGVSQARVLSAKYDVAPDKTWQIDFNLPLDERTVTKENIYVYDLNGSPVDCAVSLTGAKTVSVSPPKGGYTLWNTYALYISADVLSTDGKSMTKPVIMLFVPGT